MATKEPPLIDIEHGSEDGNRCCQPRSLRIEAPCALPQGYVVYASCGEKVIPVAVPRGGVESGQIFEGSVVSGSHNYYGHIHRSSTSASQSSDWNGNWNDGLFCCFRLGCCHPSLLNACFCPQLLLAQIFHRLGLSWADLAPRSPWLRRLFCQNKDLSGVAQKRRMLLWFALLFVVETVLTREAARFTAQQQSYTGHKSSPPTLVDYVILNEVLCVFLSIPLTIYSVYIVCRLRGHIRARYRIPNPCGTMGDGLAVVCCYSCSMAQMARQTQLQEPDGEHPKDSPNLDTARCCTKNGLDTTERMGVCEIFS